MPQPTSSSFDKSLDTFFKVVNKRDVATAIVDEEQTIPAGSPYTLFLNEKPDSTQTITITGSATYVEHSAAPTSSGEFQVDYNKGVATFHSSDAGDALEIDYYGLGSIFRVEQLQELQSAVATLQNLLGTRILDDNQFATVKARLDAGTGQLLTRADYSTESRSVYVQSTTNNPAWMYPNTPVIFSTETQINFSTGGAYETTSITAAWFNKALLYADRSSNISMREGTEAATAAGVTEPELASFGEMPIAMVTIQDNGSNGTGTIENISNNAIVNYHMQIGAFDNEMKPSLKETVQTSFFSTATGQRYLPVEPDHSRVLTKIVGQLDVTDGESTRISFVRSTGLAVSTENELFFSTSVTVASVTIAGPTDYESAALLLSGQEAYLSAVKMSTVSERAVVYCMFNADPDMVASATTAYE